MNIWLQWWMVLLRSWRLCKQTIKQQNRLVSKMPKQDNVVQSSNAVSQFRSLLLLEGKCRKSFLWFITRHPLRDILNCSVWMYGWTGLWPSGWRWRRIGAPLVWNSPILSSSADGSRVAGSPPGDDFFYFFYFFQATYALSALFVHTCTSFIRCCFQCAVMFTLPCSAIPKASHCYPSSQLHSMLLCVSHALCTFFLAERKLYEVVFISQRR